MNDIIPIWEGQSFNMCEQTFPSIGVLAICGITLDHSSITRDKKDWRIKSQSLFFGEHILMVPIYLKLEKTLGDNCYLSRAYIRKWCLFWSNIRKKMTLEFFVNISFSRWRSAYFLTVRTVIENLWIILQYYSILKEGTVYNCADKLFLCQ